jgi:hypothetical protein
MQTERMKILLARIDDAPFNPEQYPKFYNAVHDYINCVNDLTLKDIVDLKLNEFRLQNNENGSEVNIEFSSEVISLIAYHVAMMFKASGAVNFSQYEMELNADIEECKDIGPLIMTIQRKFGLRPEQKYLDNMKEIQRLKDELSVVTTLYNNLISSL